MFHIAHCSGFAKPGVRFQEIQNLLCNQGRVCGFSPQRAFPNHKYSPTPIQQGGEIALIPVDVLLEFGKPEFLTRRGGCCHPATMSMPVTAVNKNGCAVSGQDDVRFPWQILPVESISVSIPPEPFANHHLGARVLPLDSGHVETALFRGMDVHQSAFPDFSDRISL